MCTQMFIVTLFTIAQNGNPLKCPLIDEWINKFWCIYIYTTQYCLAIKKNNVPKHGTTWMNLRSIRLRERRVTHKVIYCTISFYYMYWMGKSIATENRLVDTRSLAAGGMRIHCLMGMSYFCGWWKCLVTKQRYWLQNTANLLNATDLYILKWLVLRYRKFNPQPREKKKDIFSKIGIYRI